MIEGSARVPKTELECARWHKSTYSGSNNDCVEHAALPSGRHAVRDTKDRTLGAHTFAPAPWQAFVTAVRDDSL
ncbi:DUF397 domain-containing protein [Streptomyces sp. ME02-6991-2A]|uniref:DUF397 domain-containing protein n=1 Tax=Streptomyces sp. ME02-6991-2A TaxID=3028677 RepID=UPI001008067A|nr:DUF397 domain-containing protein [Streptomyces sp. ME02-6991-2A]MDX3379421.1 DUF397 domain-containing protein [Streptomyces sp. ME02-6991-2A]